MSLVEDWTKAFPLKSDTGLCTPKGKVQDIIEERESDYGDFKKSHENIADLWTAWLYRRGITTSKLEGSDVAMMMHLMKISRQGNKHKEDNLLDAEAYWKFYKEMI